MSSVNRCRDRPKSIAMGVSCMPRDEDVAGTSGSTPHVSIWMPRRSTSSRLAFAASTARCRVRAEGTAHPLWHSLSAYACAEPADRPAADRSSGVRRPVSTADCLCRPGDVSRYVHVPSYLAEAWMARLGGTRPQTTDGPAAAARARGWRGHGRRAHRERAGLGAHRCSLVECGGSLLPSRNRWVSVACVTRPLPRSMWFAVRRCGAGRGRSVLRRESRQGRSWCWHAECPGL
jgi:hypothetical protein